MSRALIIGIAGQDGSYLARLLLEKGYEVYGTSRDHEASSFSNLLKLKIKYFRLISKNNNFTNLL